MSLFTMLEVPLILFTVVVVPIWLIMHYRSQNSASKSMTPEDEKLLSDLWQSTQRMEDRIRSLERILDADTPEWKDRR